MTIPHSLRRAFTFAFSRYVDPVHSRFVVAGMVGVAVIWGLLLMVVVS